MLCGRPARRVELLLQGGGKLPNVSAGGDGLHVALRVRVRMAGRVDGVGGRVGVRRRGQFEVFGRRHPRGVGRDPPIVTAPASVTAIGSPPARPFHLAKLTLCSFLRTLGARGPAEVSGRAVLFDTEQQPCHAPNE